MLSLPLVYSWIVAIGPSKSPPTTAVHILAFGRGFWYSRNQQKLIFFLQELGLHMGVVKAPLCNLISKLTDSGLPSHTFDSDTGFGILRHLYNLSLEGIHRCISKRSVCETGGHRRIA